MRLAPVPMRYAATPLRAIELSADSSRTTHAAPVAVDACRYLAALIVGALDGAAKEELLATRYSPVPGYWDAHPLCSEIDEVASGSFATAREIRGTGTRAIASRLRCGRLRQRIRSATDAFAR